MISLQNLEKVYEHGVSKTYVLRRVNIDVKAGEFLSIMGPSGAGKSTLLHILGMHDSAWSGECYFLDQPVHRLKPKDRAELYKRYVGFVFQSYHLLDNLTVYETWRSRCRTGTSRGQSGTVWCTTRSTGFRSSVRRISLRPSSRVGNSSLSPSRER